MEKENSELMPETGATGMQYPGGVAEEVFHSDYHAVKKSRRIYRMFGHWVGLFFVIVFAILLYYGLSNISNIFHSIGYVFGLIRPVIYGLVIAYLVNPLMKRYQRFFEWAFIKRRGELAEKKKKNLLGLCRGLSIALALISGLLIITVLLWMVIPQLATSMGSMMNTLPEQAEDYYHKVRKWIVDNPHMANRVQEVVLKLTGSLDEWIQNDLFPWLQTKLLPNVNSMASGVTKGIFSVLGVLYNLLIGLIVAVYLLGGKEKFIAQAKKLLYSVFGKKQANVILHYSRLTNDMFSGFINGKLVDSTIIGIICFVVMSILRLPYALLVSVIVGVTNIIPVFGPYLGAIPSAFLILLVNPVQCVYFVILIVILQQLDGNVIGPAILGESTGLSAFWVLFAILLFGGMWGIVGMLVGVPLFAVIYRVLKDILELRLYHKHLSTDTEMYQGLKSIRRDMNGDEHYIWFTPLEQKNANVRKKAEEETTLMDILEQKPIKVPVTAGRDSRVDAEKPKEIEGKPEAEKPEETAGKLEMEAERPEETAGKLEMEAERPEETAERTEAGAEKQKTETEG